MTRARVNYLDILLTKDEKDAIIVFDTTFDC